MRRACVLLVCAALAWPLGAAAQPRVPEAKAAFEARQRDLVALAGHLGALHRLRQVCYVAENPDLFRARMMTLVPLEMPMGGTRLDMISAFNAGYRSASSLHTICGREARAAYAAEAERALAVTERLYAPFR